MMLHLFQYLFRWLVRADIRITELEIQMSEVQSDQAHLDADVAAEGQSIDAIEAEVQALKDAQQNGQPLDFTALDSVVARLKGDEPAPAPAPAPAPDQPTA